MEKSKCLKLRFPALANKKMDFKELEQWLTKEIPKECEDEAEKIILRYTQKVQATAKRMAPVDTGYLEGSIEMKIENGGMTGIVYVGAEYGGYVEFGTANHFAQPFFYPAYEMFVPNFLSDMGKMLARLGD